jgi:large subunit ribosomal protein L6
MSRIGDNPVTVPSGVTVTIDRDLITVNGPKGTLTQNFLTQVTVVQEDGKVIIKRKKDDQFSRSVHGLTRSLINNMVVGVTDGWKKDMEMVGVGYRAQGGGDRMTLSVGFSHPVTIQAPQGVTFAVTENTKLSVSGIDKNLVSQVAANIRAVKPPEVYKGKGIRYVGEYVRRKAGKAGKAAGAAK